MKFLFSFVGINAPSTINRTTSVYSKLLKYVREESYGSSNVDHFMTNTIVLAIKCRMWIFSPIKLEKSVGAFSLP